MISLNDDNISAYSAIQSKWCTSALFSYRQVVKRMSFFFDWSEVYRVQDYLVLLDKL